MPLATEEMTTVESFDYFIKTCQHLNINQAKYFENVVLDPNLNQERLFNVMKQHFLRNIINNPKFADFQIDFSYGVDGKDDFIIATLVDPVENHEINIEINRGDSLESIEQDFAKGYQTSKNTFATAVYELKKQNHQ